MAEVKSNGKTDSQDWAIPNVRYAGKFAKGPLSWESFEKAYKQAKAPHQEVREGKNCNRYINYSPLLKYRFQSFLAKHPICSL